MPIGMATRPDDNGGDDGNNHRRRQPLGNDVGDRFIVVAAAIRAERTPEIAIDDEVAHPAEVLVIKRSAQAVALLQARNLSFVNGQALTFQPGHITAEVIAGRQLNDDEGDHRQQYQHGNKDENPAYNNAKHLFLRADGSSLTLRREPARRCNI